ncbi:MAG: DEAD/DEAH box helicase [Bdellovibrionaceae bacterium]|nr:DEAD/DEAH box helicase [Pseudobdellovibrionaceae bacterium]
MQSFRELALPEALEKALSKLNFKKPTEIQKQTIPLVFDGQDVIACASTGSGKTGAFIIPIVQKLIENKESHALVLAPTRELAMQIAEFSRFITSHCEGISMAVITGGSDMHRQLNALKRKPRLLIGTPGRLNDHLRRGSLSLKKTGILVLDEGDRMLDMGFAPQLESILKFLPPARQTMLFTATLPPKVRVLAGQYLKSPKSIQIGEISQPVKTVSQSAVSVQQGEKNNRLLEEVNKRSGSVIVFTRTQRRADAVSRYLSEYGLPVGTIHGGLTQGKRNRAIQAFRDGEVRILCATDIAARGIDVPSVEHVINYDLPLVDEDYVHRVGRTARNGARGEALSFVANEEFGLWNVISRKYNVSSPHVVPPHGQKKQKGPGPKKQGSSQKQKSASAHPQEYRQHARKNARPSRDENASRRPKNTHPSRDENAPRRPKNARPLRDENAPRYPKNARPLRDENAPRYPKNARPLRDENAPRYSKNASSQREDSREVSGSDGGQNKKQRSRKDNFYAKNRKRQSFGRKKRH